MRFWKPRKIEGTPKVGIAVAAYLATDRDRAGLLGLVQSFKAQTYRDWEMLITHDGHPDERGLDCLITATSADVRVAWTDTLERKQQFGHPHRQAAIERHIAHGCTWISLTNQDNYYVPTYLEWMVSAAQEKKADFVYCDMVHSHKQWRPLPGEIRRGHIDLGGFLVHKDVAAKVKFDKCTFAGDWDYISRLRAASKRQWHVPATLFVHN